MIDVVYTRTFVSRFKKLEDSVAEEAYKKIELFKDSKNHRLLKVHKLHGGMKNSFSLSVNHKTRIIFRYLDSNQVVLTAIDDHSIYK